MVTQELKTMLSFSSKGIEAIQAKMKKLRMETSLMGPVLDKNFQDKGMKNYQDVLKQTGVEQIAFKEHTKLTADQLLRQSVAEQTVMDKRSSMKAMTIAQQQQTEQLQMAETERNEKMANGLKTIQGAMLGMGLTMLFGGMAIKKMAEGGIRAMLNTYALVQTENTAFSQQTARLSGAWEFLKYSIMDALMQNHLVTGFIEGLIKFIDWLSQLDDGWKIAFGGLLVALAIVGSAMMIFGQIFLLSMLPVTILNVAIDLFRAAAVKAFGASMLAKLKLFVAALWSAVVAIARVVAITLAWVALAALAIALAISIGFIWDNIMTAIGIRFKQLVLGAKILWQWIKYMFQMAGYTVLEFALNMRLELIKAFNIVGEKFHGFIQGMIDGFNSVVPKWMQLEDLDPFSGMDTSNAEQMLFDLARAKTDFEIDAIVKGEELKSEQDALNEALAANLEDAGKNLKDGWNGIFDSVGEGYTSVKEKMGFDDSTPADNSTNTDKSVTITNNLTLIGGDAKTFKEDGDKLLARQEEGQKVFFGCTGA